MTGACPEVDEDVDPTTMAKRQRSGMRPFRPCFSVFSVTFMVKIATENTEDTQERVSDKGLIGANEMPIFTRMSASICSTGCQGHEREWSSSVARPRWNGALQKSQLGRRLERGSPQEPALPSTATGRSRRAFAAVGPAMVAELGVLRIAWTARLLAGQACATSEPCTATIEFGPFGSLRDTRKTRKELSVSRLSRVS